MRRALTIATVALVALPALAALAQQSWRIGDLPDNEPVFIPAPSQDSEGSRGGLFRKIEPIDPPRTARSGDADGSGGFIDRAFGMRPGEENDRQALPRDGGFSSDWFTEDGNADDRNAGDAEDAAGRSGTQFREEGDGRRRFQEAPTTSARLFGPSLPSALPQVQTVATAGGAIRKLDKMTGATETLEMRAGETVDVGRLRISLDACRRPAQEGRQGTMGFLRIWDQRESESDPVFSGWMFAESPALSALDHPRYDVWLESCRETTATAPEDDNAPEAGEG